MAQEREEAAYTLWKLVEAGMIWESQISPLKMEFVCFYKYSVPTAQ
jgi:hypothetical protein